MTWETIKLESKRTGKYETKKTSKYYILLLHKNIKTRKQKSGKYNKIFIFLCYIFPFIFSYVINSYDIIFPFCTPLHITV